LYPNMLVAWRFAPSRLMPVGKINSEVDIEFGAINHRARQGTFQSQIRPELVPFDYTDFQIHYDSAYNLMTKNSSVGGIADMSFKDTIDRRRAYVGDGSKMTLEQEEAAGHYWGTVNLLVAAIEVLTTAGIDLAGAKTQLEGALTAKGVSPLVRKIFANAYRNDIVGFEVDDKPPATALGDNVLALRRLGSTFHSGHVMGNFYSKTTKILGKSMNYAGPSETLDMMAQHTVL
jgi:hypothetical protein